MSKYYDDAAKVIWMEREFGVKFTNAEGEIVIGVCERNRVGVDIDIITPEGFLSDEAYIHEDSLPIFSPQDGDVVRDEGNVAIIAPDHHEYKHADLITLKELMKWDNYIIIQRNGKPFFTPMEKKA